MRLRSHVGRLPGDLGGGSGNRLQEHCQGSFPGDGGRGMRQAWRDGHGGLVLGGGLEGPTAWRAQGLITARGASGDGAHGLSWPYV